MSKKAVNVMIGFLATLAVGIAGCGGGSSSGSTPLQNNSTSNATVTSTNGMTASQVVSSTPDGVATITIPQSTPLYADAAMTQSVSGVVTTKTTAMITVSALPVVAQTGTLMTSSDMVLDTIGGVVDITMTNGTSMVKAFGTPITVNLKLVSGFASVGSTVDYYSVNDTGNWTKEGTATVKTDGSIDMSITHLSMWGTSIFRHRSTPPTTLKGWSKIAPNVFMQIVVNPADNKIVFAGASNGIFKSTDGGANWAEVTKPTTKAIYSIALSPNGQTIYASAYPQKVFKSTDAGTTWSELIVPTDLTMTTVSGIYITVDPNNNNVLYSTLGHKVFKSIDGGAMWNELVINYNPNYSVYGNSLAPILISPVNSQVLYINVNAGSGFEGGLAYSANGGASLTLGTTGAGSGYKSVAIDPGNSKVVYAWTTSVARAAFYTYNGGGTLFKSSDSGATWSALTNGLPGGVMISALSVDPNNSNIVYATSSSVGEELTPNSATSTTTAPMVFKSIDGGNTWQTATAGLPDITAGNGMPISMKISIDPTNSQTIYLPTSAGLYKSTSGGE